MTALLAMSCLSALVFVEQPIEGLYVGHANPLTGRPPLGFYQADFDADGKTDLLLPAEQRPEERDSGHAPGIVAFQRDGLFPDSARVSLPAQDAPTSVDVWGRNVYVRAGDRLRIFAFEDGAWATRHDQHLAWPRDAFGEDVLGGGQPLAPAHKANMTPFLHDLDGDGTPEIVLIDGEGIHVYWRDETEYTASPVLALLPPLRLMDVPRQTLWPSSQRHIAFPARQMFCRVIVDDALVSVISSTELGDGRLTYQTDRYLLANDGTGYAVAPDGHAQSSTPPMPDYMRPCRLNGDGMLDYAGGDWEYSEAGVLPTWIHTTGATTDGGGSFAFRRASYFRPYVLFTDFDNDGDSDMVTESTGLYAGGLRETVNRLFTSRKLRHEICVYFQDSAGKFGASPDIQQAFNIQLVQPPISGGPMFQAYLGMSLVDCTGDFDGDGFRDVVLRDKIDRLAVHLYRGGAFTDAPVATLPFASRLLGVADVDGDGRSDIVQFSADIEEAQSVTHVHFSREEMP